MSSTSPSTLAEQLDQISASIPEPIATRISADTAELALSGEAPGLAVGEAAPDFTLLDQLGRTTSLHGLLESGPVVVTFYRGEWCPFCNIQLREIQSSLDQLIALGASLVAISPQAPDHSLSLAEKHDLTFAVLSDLDQSTIRAYRVQFTLTGDLEDLQVNVFANDPALQNADGTRTLPVPATFVIDRGGVIRAAFVSPDWRSRPEPSRVIEALKAL